jgi:hypothetical protein
MILKIHSGRNSNVTLATSRTPRTVASSTGRAPASPDGRQIAAGDAAEEPFLDHPGEQGRRRVQGLA